MRLYERQVKNGIAWLNMNVPAWRTQLDVDRLNMSNDCHCILGQLYGSFRSALTQLNDPEDSTFVVDHGFDITTGGYFGDLEDEWRLQLGD